MMAMALLPSYKGADGAHSVFSFGKLAPTSVAMSDASSARGLTSSKTTTTSSVTDTGSFSGITKAAIDAACAVHEQRRIERQDQGHEALDRDYEDELPLEDVVVARNVTLGDLCDVPDDWLGGVQLALLPDGTLVVDRLASQEHSRVSIEVFAAIRDYARANRGHSLGSTINLTINCGPLGWRTPGVVLDQRVVAANTLSEPLVIVDVFTEKRPSCVKIFERVAAYFRNNASVVRVVVFKFFSPRNPARVDGLVEVPALAMAFGLTNPLDRDSLIQVTEIESFGNAGTSQRMVDGLVVAAGSVGFQRLHPATEARLRQPTMPIVIVSMDPLPGLDLFRLLNENDLGATFTVGMPAPLDPMTFDLVTLFEEAIKGRYQDDADRRMGLQQWAITP